MSSQSKYHGNSLVEQNLLTWKDWYFLPTSSILLQALRLGFGYNLACNLFGNLELCFTLDLIPKYPFTFVNKISVQGWRFQGPKKVFMLVATEISHSLSRFLMLLECRYLRERELLNSQCLPARNEWINKFYSLSDLGQVTAVFYLSFPAAYGGSQG